MFQAEITEVTVNYGRTVNMGNFESLRIDLSARATVPPNTAVELVVDQVYGNLRAHAQRLIAEEVKATR